MRSDDVRVATEASNPVVQIVDRDHEDVGSVLSRRRFGEQERRDQEEQSDQTGFHETGA